jgi:tetratricopeptide (TPR) repeat protein
LATLRSLGDRVLVGTCLSELAGCYRQLDQLESALACGQEAVELLRLMDPGPLGEALFQVGSAQRSMGLLEDARQTFDEAIELASPEDARQIKRLEAELATLGVTSQASA